MRQTRLLHVVVLCLVGVMLGPAGPRTACGDDIEAFAADLAPWADALGGRLPHFTIDGQCRLKVAGKPRSIRIRAARYDEQSFDVSLTDVDYAVALYRRPNRTVLALPKHRRAFVGSGAPPKGNDRLGGSGLLQRCVSADSNLGLLPTLLGSAPEALATFLNGLFTVQRTPAGDAWLLAEKLRLQFTGESLTVSTGDFEATLRLRTELGRGSTFEVQLHAWQVER